MKRAILTALFGLPFLLSAHSALANYNSKTRPNWYVGLHGEITYVEDTDVIIGGANGGEISFETETSWGIAAGYQASGTNTVLDHIRYEFEYTYRNYNLDQLTTGTGRANLDGSLKGQAFMINGFFDVPTGTMFTPYIGSGIGAIIYDLDSTNFAVDENEAAFAYQFMIGAYFSPKALRGTDLGVGYRYFMSTDPEFKNSLGTSVELESSAHNIEFLARFRF